MVERGQGAADAGLTIAGLSLTRRGLRLVEGLNLRVEPGCVLGVTGASGAGKTTLLRSIAGTTDFEGQVIRPRGRLGFVFQEPRLLPWRTARANVELAAPDTPDRLFIAEEWLERVELGDACGLYPHQLSGGMRQRVAIARALACTPSLLLVDEPFSALDKPLALALRGELLALIRAANIPVVWVTHDGEEAGAVSDQHLHLHGPPGAWELV